jgi:tetraacyldisaccharide 4'-kinase
MKLLDALLWPPTVLYEAGTRVRNAAYDRKMLSPNRLSGVVISVGNLTVGGTGKTPMVLWIAQRLLAEGKKVGVLTRGYRGTSPPVESSDGAISSSASNPLGSASSGGNSSSDEVRMLGSRLGGQVGFGVGPNRFARGRELAARGIDWFVLDDGFQHRQLARDVDIVLIDATNPFGGGNLLPQGRLREPRSGLSRADIIVITRREHSPAIEAAVQHDSRAPIFYARPSLDSVQSVNNGMSAPEGISKDLAARAQKVFAFCGIGNPPAFLTDLRDWGFQVAGQRFFRDHHRYTSRDLGEIQAEAGKACASSLICTEKDIFNLPRDLSGVPSQVTLPILYCRISLRIDREEEFWRAILAKLGSHA